MGTTTTATYDAANHLTSLGGVSYSYDRNGNLTGYGSNSLSYDAANTWTGGTVNGNTVAFGYDGLGRRVSRSIAGAGTQYWYDNTGMGLETGASSATYLRSPEGRLLSIKSAAGFANYASDRQGTVTATTNQSGGLVNTYRYDPWGSSVGTTGTAYNEYRYAGTYREPDLGLYQMGARFYMPTTGRFTQQDPLPRSVVEANQYHYTGGDPVNYTDPTGLCICLAPAAGIGFSLGPVGWVALGAVAIGTAGYLVYQATQGEGEIQIPDPPSDPAQSPGEGWEWRGAGPVGSNLGAWFNPATGESLHPDLNHPEPIEPHWDYENRNTGVGGRIYLDGTFAPD